MGTHETETTSEVATAAPAGGPGRPGGADRLGMAGSGLCAVHCLAGSALAAGTWLHPAFAAVLVPLTLYAMQESSPRVRGFLGFGAVLVMVALLGHGLPWAWAGTVLTLAGSLLLILGHGTNRRECRPAAA
jgi:hypothetical protein